MSPTSPYVPPTASLELHRQALVELGFERSVGVQIIAYAEDNTVLAEAVDRSAGTMRGIATLRADQATDAQIERLHAAGIRGLRFYFEPPKVLQGIQFAGVGLADLVALAPRMKALGWVAEISATCDRIVELAPRLETLGIPIVLEHMAGCPPARGPQDPVVRQLVDLLKHGPFWAKLTICGISGAPPDYEDVRPLHDAFIAAAPHHLIWGSDWPHILRDDAAPDVGHLVDLFDDWIDADDALRHAILSHNPERLFSF